MSGGHGGNIVDAPDDLMTEKLRRRLVRPMAAGLWRDQQPRTGNGRERHRDLELRIVAPAGALVGVGPAVVEDVLALGVGLRVAGRSGDDLAGACLDRRICTGCQPERPPTQPEILERRQEGVRDEGVVGLGRLRPVAGRGAGRARAPGGFAMASHCAAATALRRSATRIWISRGGRLTRRSCSWWRLQTLMSVGVVAP